MTTDLLFTKMPSATSFTPYTLRSQASRGLRRKAPRCLRRGWHYSRLVYAPEAVAVPGACASVAILR